MIRDDVPQHVDDGAPDDAEPDDGAGGKSAMRKYAICRLQAAHKFEMQFKCDTAGNGWLLVVQRTMPTPS